MKKKVCRSLFAGMFVAMVTTVVVEQRIETGFLNRTLTVNGSEYRYVVYVPREFTRAGSWPVIVQLHGGRLFVESTRHKGSVFIVHLPVEKRKGAARRQAQRRILILDLGKDVPGLADLAGAGRDDFAVDYVSASLRDWAKRRYSRFDVLLINEPAGFEEFGRDYYLLALSGLSSEARCGLLVPAGMPEADKEVRRYLGFTVLEKPCTPEELFDKLLGIVGLDRRQKTG